MELTNYELMQCAKNPVIFRALADHHDCIATLADAIGIFAEAVKYHESRAKELRDAADKIESEY